MLGDNEITFVQEFATYAKNFNVDPRPVAAVSISRCTLMEMINRDPVTKHRSAFSLSHFIVDQLGLPDSGIIQENLQKITDSFVQCGGNLETAQIRIYGGFEARETLRACPKSL
jgi:hypothetical protein